MHPPDYAHLLTASATSLAAALRRRELTSAHLVDVHVRHLERVNGRLNAVVETCLHEAHQQAAEADRQLDAGGSDLPPLLGVPCTIKESFAMAGMPNTAGLVARRGRLATHDAPTVARLRAAGAIALGVTNTSELCMWLESSNRVYGRTNNPYDPRHMVGGSSGGEGAIVAAGASPFGLGSDIGGSIRLPAFFNGVFGHKCSMGLVPTTGQYPPAEGDARRLLSTGPLCRRAEDLMPLLRILAGPDGEDDTTVATQLGDPAAVDVAGLRVVVVEQPGLRGPDRAQKSALRRVAAALKARGATLVTLPMPALRRGFLLWSQRLSAASPHRFHALLGEGQERPLAREWLRWVLRRSDHTLPALALAALEKVPAVSSVDSADTAKALEALRSQIDEALGPSGVLICPTFPQPAPRHGWAMLTPFDAGYTAVFNALGSPVTAVPTGLATGSGLPTGVQVVGRHGADHVTIAVAQALEQDLGGWVPPWTVGGLS